MLIFSITSRTETYLLLAAASAIILLLLLALTIEVEANSRLRSATSTPVQILGTNLTFNGTQLGSYLDIAPFPSNDPDRYVGTGL